MQPGSRVAVSYDTSTFNDLACYLPGVTRIDPEQFLEGADQSHCYINLVCKDLSLRRRISDSIDARGLRRFSYIHDKCCAQGARVAPGAFLYPGVILYPGVELDSDALIHSNSAVGHRTRIGRGAYISGGVTIGGRSQVGDWCMLGLGANVFDLISIANNVIIGAGVTVRKSITQAGTYSQLGLGRLIRVK